MCDYAPFARAIEAACKFFGRQELPLGTTATLLSESPGHDLILVMFLRTIGLGTPTVWSLVQAVGLKIRSVTSIVAREAQQVRGFKDWRWVDHRTRLNFLEHLHLELRRWPMKCANGNSGVGGSTPKFTAPRRRGQRNHIFKVG